MSLSSHQREQLQKYLDRAREERDHAKAGKHNGVVPQPSTYEEDEHLGQYCTELY